MIKQYKMWKKRRDEQQFQTMWDKKSNASIITAYNDAKDWLNFDPIVWDSNTLNGIRETANMRLDNYILPQMKKRGMEQ